MDVSKAPSLVKAFCSISHNKFFIRYGGIYHGRSGDGERLRY